MRHLWKVAALVGVSLFITCTVLASISTVILQSSVRETAELESWEFEGFTFNHHVLPSEKDSFICKEFDLDYTKQAPIHGIAFKAVPGSQDPELILQMRLFACDSIGKKGYYHCEATPAHCQQLIFSWVPGQSDFILPSVVGIPFGPRGFNYVLLQVHYDTVLFETVDNSGVVITLTNLLRPFDAGYLLVGPASSNISIPAKQTEFVVSGDCPSSSIASIINNIPDKNSMKVLASFPFAHRLATSVSTSLVRGGSIYNNLNPNANYTFGSTGYSSSSAVILPGDQLITKCTYNTMSANSTTTGGYDQSSELCFNFLLYYPFGPSRCEGNLPTNLPASSSRKRKSVIIL
eukprot:TRINITY_DN3380_c0_g1_i1.p1 TRINITY_DN3380_c0_g1~~TRINITY_DN3380_c0_g1_i1.p1  ORF type:complete len:348 (-),score=93.37 TRINITY_DN3380_c0_g1_i1:88-1131(-)